MRIKTTKPHHEVSAILQSIPGAIKGTGPDPYLLGVTYRSALAYSLMTSLYEGFILKSYGGVDKAGHSWPPLKAATKAYHKPSVRRGMTFSGPKRRPTLTKAQDRFWKDVFIDELEKLRQGITTNTKRTPKKPSDRKRLGYPIGPTPRSKFRQITSFLSRKGRALKALVLPSYNTYNAFLASVSVEEAQARHLAAAKAWQLVKKMMGATTLIEILGDKQARIEFETGRLQESYNPGDYRVPYFSTNPDQLVSMRGSKVVIGSRVEYRPRTGSIRSVVPPNMAPLMKKAKKDAKLALINRLIQIL